VAVTCAPTAYAQARLQSYPTRYYVIRTDLDLDAVREATVRITAMAEEYHARTRGFAGSVTDRLEFYIFRHPADYYANGGPQGSAGVFVGDRLLAIGGDRVSPETWHIVQHEGFHQFAHHVIGGDIPTWVDEGLAEYFGESLFTGDGYVSGVISQNRLQRVRYLIQNKQFKTIAQLMTIDRITWNQQLSGANYDQAWSMVQFLAHGEGGRYQKAFSGFISDVAKWSRWQDAWKKHFGADAGAFESAWRDYWTSVPDNPTADLYVEAVVRTLTGYLGRAAARKQTFETAEAFFDAARGGRLERHAEDWLPADLLTDALGPAPQLGRWLIEDASATRGKLVLTLPGDRRVVGVYTVRNGRIGDVTIEDASKPGASAPQRTARPGTQPIERGRPRPTKPPVKRP